MVHTHIISCFCFTRLLLFYSLLAALLCGFAFADPPYTSCSNTKDNSSSFQNNLNNLLLSFQSNASLPKFYSTSTGNNSADKIYGLYMCLDYATNGSCQDCITTASTDIVKLCPDATEAIVWEDLCNLRYSNKDFFGQLDVTGNVPQINVHNSSEPEQFRSVVSDTLSNLTKRAAFDIPSPSAYKYATEEVPYKDSTIYAMVQCATDLSAEDCNTCLQTAISDILTCCYFSIGARLMSRSCFLRYELYPFYGGAVSLPNTLKGSGRKIRMIIIFTTVPLCLALALLGYCVYYLAMNKRAQKRKIHPYNADNQHPNFPGSTDAKEQESPDIDLASILLATNNFSELNKLGRGGFGPVYKGILSDGKEVAIKRLSRCSEQGSREFTTEVLLIMKLQHKNLVRLLGFCVNGEEKLLAYEYMPNGSLDVFLFDPKKRVQLNWSRRVSIISGIARGILYLHEDSRLRIIHRDLKASNVLLDNDMNPKISDFGMARIFEGNEGEANTGLIVGTYGYMAPEYAMEGLYSVKSDVYSFGVLLLEILTGRKNSGSYRPNHTPSLLACIWKSWNEGIVMELMDPLLTDSCCPDEFLRYIHIGLLCIQENLYDRPTMSYVVLMLKSPTVTLRQPGRPAFTGGRFTDDDDEANVNRRCSVNGVTISSIVPR